ncbi:condensation domain-containing protein [Kitasatospora sp. CMC57]
MHRLAPGRVVEWRLRSTAPLLPPPRSPGLAAARRASFNQEKHFTAAEETRAGEEPTASWIAVTFEVAGPLDESVMARVLLNFVGRHEVLRSVFQRLAGELSCKPGSVEDMSLELHEVGDFDSGELLAGHLADRFRHCIDTLSWPLFTAGAVLREDSATVYLAFDHIVCDGMSMPIVVHELQTAYEAALLGEQAVLPSAPSYLDFADEQRRRYLAIGADDPRLDYWKSFIARNGEFFPRFPLDLGVQPGRMYPIVNEASTLLDAEEADLFEKQCFAVDGKPFMGVLAASAVSLREVGGPGVYRGFMPVSERGGGPWAHSMGWFVNTLPIEFDVSVGQDFAQVMAGVRAAFTEMIGHLDVPFVRAWELLAPEEFAARDWPYPVNFFSYIDMRKCAGAERYGNWRPTSHVWSAHSNGTCTWFQRDAEGLHINSIYVDTPRARRTMGDLLDALRRTVQDITRADTARVFVPSAR